MYTSKEIFKNTDFAATLPLKVLSPSFTVYCSKKLLDWRREKGLFYLTVYSPPIKGSQGRNSRQEPRGGN